MSHDIEQEVDLLKAISVRLSTLREVGELPPALDGLDALGVKSAFQKKWKINRKAATLFIRQAAGPQRAEMAIRMWTDDGVATAARKNPFGFSVGV